MVVDSTEPICSESDRGGKWVTVGWCECFVNRHAFATQFKAVDCRAISMHCEYAGQMYLQISFVKSLTSLMEQDSNIQFGYLE